MRFQCHSNGSTWVAFALIVVAVATMDVASAFSNHPKQRLTGQSSSTLWAAPQRLAENAEGVVYVNDKCINCAACQMFAPSVFKRADTDYAHIVHHQPTTKDEIMDARAAMSACPVAAIRSETLAQRRHRLSEEDKQSAEDLWTTEDEALVKQMALSTKVNGLDLPFPRPLLFHDASTNTDTPTTPNHKLRDVVYNVGHHNEKSFGAIPYLVQGMANSKSVWIMVDTPRFGKSAIDAVKQVTGPEGPDYLFLTHVDDTEGHGKWTEEFPSLQRIFHTGDTGKNNWTGDLALDNDVEIMLAPPTSDAKGAPFYAYAMDGTPMANNWYQAFMEDSENDVVILHTPGHSPGSITLWKKPSSNNKGNELPGVIFTGDHYALTSRTGRMTGFPRYGNDLELQAKTMEDLLHLDWDVVAPGHGHPRDYSAEPNKTDLKRKEMEEAIVDLHK